MLSLLLSAAIFVCFVLQRAYRRRSRSTNAPSSPTTGEKGSARDLGEWDPDFNFKFPTVTRYPESLENIKPIPYRPFRWTPYNVTMGIRNMPWDEWIELDSEFASYHKIKVHRVHDRGRDVVNVLDKKPGVVGSGRASAVELVHELAEYVLKRFPESFVADRTDEGFAKSVRVVPVDVSYELPLHLLSKHRPTSWQSPVGVSEEDGRRAMEIAGFLVQEDLALMLEGTDGRYFFQAGSVCIPGFWRMKDKIGLPLEEIHTSGNVPQYQQKLHTSLARFFRRMAVDKPVIRNNYFIQIVRSQEEIDLKAEVDPEELGWSTSTNGNEDTYTHSHPNLPVNPTPETLRMRSERQTLRRLPLTGAIVFTIRTYLYPVEDLAKEPGVPARMATAIRSWGEDVAEYKGRTRYEEVLVGYLDRKAEEQKIAGVWDGEKVAKNAYPF